MREVRGFKRTKSSGNTDLIGSLSESIRRMTSADMIFWMCEHSCRLGWMAHDSQVYGSVVLAT